MMEKLTPKMIIAASVIAIGHSQKAAADKAGVTEQTVSEWGRKPEFKALINQVKLQLLYDAQDKLRGMVLEAVKVISRTMNSSESEKLRFEAAKYVLSIINIAPMNDAGLWWIASSPEGIKKQGSE